MLMTDGTTETGNREIAKKLKLAFKTYLQNSNNNKDKIIT